LRRRSWVIQDVRPSEERSLVRSLWACLHASSFDRHSIVSSGVRTFVRASASLRSRRVASLLGFIARCLRTFIWTWWGRRCVFVFGQARRTVDARPAPISQTTTSGAGMCSNRAVQAAGDSPPDHRQTRTSRVWTTAISRHQPSIQIPSTRICLWVVVAGPKRGSTSQHQAVAWGKVRRFRLGSVCREARP
jgi:hypothetical protein